MLRNSPFTSPRRPSLPSPSETEISSPADISILAGMPPAVLCTPDDIFAGSWSTPLEGLAAPIMAQGSSSPTDFAFEPPSDNKTPSAGYPYNPHAGPGYPHQYSNYSSGSSFSSTSGSYATSSFSSADALPAISRDFSRPNVHQAKRPATAGGILQQSRPFGGFLESERKATIVEPNFAVSPTAGLESSSYADARNASSSRRASEGHGQMPPMPPPSWPVQAEPNLPSASTQTAEVDYYSQIPQSYRSAYTGSSVRPQTSDGLPSFGGPTPLPSARSVVGSFASINPLTPALQPPAHIRSAYDEETVPIRERQPYAPTTSRSDGGHTFVTIGGPAPKKRPRRRFDEIERLYRCGWPQCEKSYGTLNHLNAHVAMQSHGIKRLPSEFKDMRKAWRKKKRDSDPSDPHRGSMSSESEFDRRSSTISTLPPSPKPHPHTASLYRTAADSRPTTASSAASSSEGRTYYTQQTNIPPFGYGQHPIPVIPSNMQIRRESAPTHVNMPHHQHLGFRPNDDGPTPTSQNPFPINFPMNYSMNPTAIEHTQHPQHPQYVLHMHQEQMGQRPGTGGYPFQALTQPMPMTHGQPYAQFAFQR